MDYLEVRSSGARSTQSMHIVGPQLMECGLQSLEPNWLLKERV